MLLLLSLLVSARASPIDHGNSPTVLQYVLEALVDLPSWSHYLPNHFDADKDGNLNEKEIEIKFKSYVRDVFGQLDKDGDKLITREEFRNAGINNSLTDKIIDIVMQSYPVKTFLDFGDRNQDGFISEDDFLIPENRDKLLREYYKEKFGDKLPDYWGDEERGTRWVLKNSVPAFKKDRWSKGNLLCSHSFGEKEAQVLCREMGHKGLESLASISFDDYKSSTGEYGFIYGFIFDCQGNENSLEECVKSQNKEAAYYRCPNREELLASVKCALDKELGEVDLVGGKNGSSGDLHIGLEKYCGDITPQMAFVVCNQLGFKRSHCCSTAQVTRNNFFTSDRGPSSIERQFECAGYEHKLEDCKAVHITRDDRNTCNGPDNGIICNPGADLSDKYRNLGRWDILHMGDTYNEGERGFYNSWEKFGRYLFVADTNGDHKVSREELVTKIKEIVSALFHVLDQTHDGVFSASDLATLNMRLPDVLNLARKLFELLAKGGQQIDLYNQHIPLVIRGPYPLSWYDYNQDSIINLEDLSNFIDGSQLEGLITILSRELDPNQDGKILTTELDNYVSGIMNHLGGTLTLNSIWKLMKEAQFTCLQINGVRTFVEPMIDIIKTQSEKMLDYFFRELDLDGNGEIPLEELYNAHVPCDEINPRKYPDNDSEPGRPLSFSDSERVGCRRLLRVFADPDIYPEAPRLERFSGNRRNRNDYYADLKEKLANSACVAMQPNF